MVTLPYIAQNGARTPHLPEEIIYADTGCFVSRHCATCLLPDCLDNLTDAQECAILNQPINAGARLYAAAIKARRALVAKYAALGWKEARIAGKLRCSQSRVRSDLRKLGLL